MYLCIIKRINQDYSILQPMLQIHSIVKAVMAFITLVLPLCATAQNTFSFGTNVNPQGVKFEVDSRGFIVGGKHVLPVMGEIHFSRVPASEWRHELQKMKAGGITMVATYVFWIHHEPVEGQCNWSGNCNLHGFLEACREEGLPVILRVGPFCHGEVYQGGIPEWIVTKGQESKDYKLRTTAPGFLRAVERLYSNIYAQTTGMLWKDGGPIVGVQIENECRGPWSYYMALKDMAVRIGFDAPFYTRTGWPKLNGNEEFGKMLPLFGDYADGFWDRNLTDMPGDYPKAFEMKIDRMSKVIATETFSASELQSSSSSFSSSSSSSSLSYPYLTCELGGGMMPAYHRRINMSGNEPFPLAVCKLGSGSNMPGYYMYHGGTNPSPTADGRTMAETQKSPVTNYNDMPYMTYDFQCPLGEMGQPNLTAFHKTRWLHQMLKDWGDELSQMDIDTLSQHYARRGCFEFYNDYVRILNEGGTTYVRPVGMNFCGSTITADAQPFCKIGNALYLLPIKGKKPVAWVDGKKIALKADREVKAKDITLCLLSEATARRAYVIDGKLFYAKNDGGILYKNDKGEIEEELWEVAADAVCGVKEVKTAGPAREIAMGTQKVAAMPSNADFDAAAVYTITLPECEAEEKDQFLKIEYKGDCARIYADGKLVEDNFWNGKPMLVRISDLAGKKIELRILPLRKDAPIYLQKEQKAQLDAAKGDTLLTLDAVSMLLRKRFAHNQ